MRRVPALAALLLLVALPTQAQFDDVEVKPIHVAGSVHMLEGAGGNIGVSVGEDGILMIDDQFAPLADKIRAALASIGGGDLKFILNTHYHGDHTGGNAVFGPEAPILSHHNVRERLASAEAVEGRPDPLPKAGWPVLTFADGITLHFNGESVEVVHIPNAHTDGDAMVFFPGSNVVHMGDILFSGLFPYVDIDGGGSVDGVLTAVETVIARVPADVTIIPGHGPISGVDDLKAYADMIRQTRAIVQERTEKGMSLEEIQAAGLPEAWASWSWSFIPTERWLATLHRDLGGGE